jgi:aconitate hydratase
MALNTTQKPIECHRVSGGGSAGAPLAPRIDQTLTRDATGTLAMLSLDRVKTAVSVQYVDHNLLQIDNLNAEDHLFLESAYRRWAYGIRDPATGSAISFIWSVSGVPVYRCQAPTVIRRRRACSARWRSAAGGLDVALAVAGEPYSTTMPAIFGVELTGALPAWVSAKDGIVTLAEYSRFRRHFGSVGLGATG